MPNSNTVAQAQTTDGKYFCPSDSMMVSSTDEAQFTKNSTLLAVYLPGSNKVKNKPIRIRAWGRATGGTTTNFTVAIYYGTSTTIGSNTALATTGACAVNSISSNWLLEIKGIWDGTSNKLIGTYSGWMGGTAVADTIIADLTKPGSAPSTEGLGFTATADSSASNAGNLVVMEGFEVLAD